MMRCFIPIKKIVKLFVTLPIVIDFSLSQIALSAIVQVKFATLFESEGIVPRHFHLFTIKPPKKHETHHAGFLQNDVSHSLISMSVKKMFEKCVIVLQNFFFRCIKVVKSPLF